MHYNQGADLFTYMTNPEVFDVKNGMVELLTGPGLGVEINEELLRAAAVDSKGWRNPNWRGPDGGIREW